MKKKGFTLIELLAVIVILAIIALIATPIVMNVIENSKKGAAERSAENYLRAVETAIASERLDGPIEDGEYEVDSNGDLVLEKEDSTKIIIQVDVNGTLPEEGSIIVIVNGLVDKTQVTIVIGDYTVEENEAGNLEATKTQPETNNSYICKKTGEASKTVGAEYSCTLKDKIPRTFYVLENNESSENISLIMDRNFTDETVSKTIAWCIDGGKYNTCKSINSKDDNPLKHIQDTFGDNVEVSFPTKDQIASANNGSTSNLPQWLYDYLINTIHPVSGVYGYWTTSPAVQAEEVWNVRNYGGMSNYDSSSLNKSGSFGVRPVITISKTQLD